MPLTIRKVGNSGLVDIKEFYQISSWRPVEDFKQDCRNSQTRKLYLIDQLKRPPKDNNTMNNTLTVDQPMNGVLNKAQSQSAEGADHLFQRKN